MALNPSACAAAISIAYQAAAGLDSAGNPAPAPITGNFAADFASAYNEYAAAGLVLGALNTGGNAAILEAALNSIDNTAAGVNALATGFANFWATVAVAPGAPMHGGMAVASVTNNAAGLVSLFQAAIIASISTTESKPMFDAFVTNVQTMAVNSIQWTVIELMPPVGTPAPFVEVIS